MAHWVGNMVSIDCHRKGIYQGEILQVNGLCITLTKAFCDGIPCAKDVIISTEDIAELQLIEKQEKSPGQSTVTVAKPIPKRVGRSISVSESMVAHKGSVPTSSSNAKSKPIDIEYKQPHGDFGVGSFKLATPNKKDKAKVKYSKKDEACFGSDLEQIVGKDFDFEKNLALFDKQAVWDEINNSQKPDIVKHADNIRKKQWPKYRHDENIIATEQAIFRQITVPKQEVGEYVTDDGLVIPSISYGLRNKLWAAANRMGLTWERRIELIGRATAEMVLQLVGGGHRLNPHNTHQCPVVVVLCGAHKQGAMGINAARHLASHGVNTVVCIKSPESSEVKQELGLYRLTKNRTANGVSDLPYLVDIIIVALSGENYDISNYQDLTVWINSNKAPVLAIDPPASGTPGISAKFSLVPVLPLAHTLDNGKLYLCNLGFPTQIFSEVGITYKSPFGSKFVIPLHPNES